MIVTKRRKYTEAELTLLNTKLEASIKSILAKFVKRYDMDTTEICVISDKFFLMRDLLMQEVINNLELAQVAGLSVAEAYNIGLGGITARYITLSFDPIFQIDK